MMGRAHTKPPDSNLLEPAEPGEGEDKTYLLFTTGSLTYSPHQIGKNPNCADFTKKGGEKYTVVSDVSSNVLKCVCAGIKRIKPDQMTTCGPVLGEERSSEFFDSLDHVIDIHGHIIGMGLSPDHR